MRDLDPSQYGEADRREVDPPIQVESLRGPPAARSTGGSKSIDRAWSGSGGYAVQTDAEWIKATDLRPAKS